jgi:hypothetical protein
MAYSTPRQAPISTGRSAIYGQDSIRRKVTGSTNRDRRFNACGPDLFPSGYEWKLIPTVDQRINGSHPALLPPVKSRRRRTLTLRWRAPGVRQPPRLGPNSTLERDLLYAGVYRNRVVEHVPAIEAPTVLATRRHGSAGEIRLRREIPAQSMSLSPGHCPELDPCDHTSDQGEAIGANGCRWRGSMTAAVNYRILSGGVWKEAQRKNALVEWGGRKVSRESYAAQPSSRPFTEAEIPGELQREVGAVRAERFVTLLTTKAQRQWSIAQCLARGVLPSAPGVVDPGARVRGGRMGRAGWFPWWAEFVGASPNRVSFFLFFSLSFQIQVVFKFNSNYCDQLFSDDVAP